MSKILNSLNLKNKILIQPLDVENQTKEYFDDNDPVKNWLVNNYEFTQNSSDQIKTSDLYNKYLDDNNLKISMVKFFEYIKLNEINVINKKGYKFFTNIKILNSIENYKLNNK